MSRIAYVNGAYVAHSQACVHVEDRGYQFSDGVYEVWAVGNGKLLDSEGHFTRLQRSLRELAMPIPTTIAALQVILREIVRQNRIRNGIVYLQITRGVAPRDHAWSPNLRPSLVITAKPLNSRKGDALAKTGVKVITTPDQRWARRDIKSVSLLPNVLAKQLAREHGAYEAWLVDADGYVTEGSSSNAWIITNDDVLVTRNVNHDILAGITRAHALDIVNQNHLRVEERAFSVEEARNAKEAFITAASAFVLPVIAVDDHVIGGGRPGQLATRLRKDYIYG